MLTADLGRYLVVLKYGGFYTDLDGLHGNVPIDTFLANAGYDPSEHDAGLCHSCRDSGAHRMHVPSAPGRPHA